MESSEPMEYIELETKYRTSVAQLYPLKHLMNAEPNFVFKYIESDDEYFTREGDETPIRYRFPGTSKEGGELTAKLKTSKKNNNKRVEPNVILKDNNYETIRRFCENIKFTPNFRIHKNAHIYYSEKEHVTIVFYSVRDEAGKLDHFIEIEVSEDAGLTEESGWDIIKSWERKLESLGIKAQNRLRKSLFELYRK